MHTDLLVTAFNRRGTARFEGEVSIAGKTFSYILEFQVPIYEYMAAAQGKTVEQIRQIVPIILRQGEETIPLTDREWKLFYYTITPSAINICNLRFMVGDHSTNHANLREGGPIDLTPEACKILAQPKFGCQFLEDTPSAGNTN